MSCPASLVVFICLFVFRLHLSFFFKSVLHGTLYVTLYVSVYVTLYVSVYVTLYVSVYVTCFLGCL
jgi:hypothetical protein